MKNNHANVIVYVKQPVEHKQISCISKTIDSLNGVIHTEVSDRSQSFVCVDYDPKLTDSLRILQSVNNHGYQARLIGM